MGGKITDDIMPNEIKKPLDKFANKFGDMFVPKELAKPLMMAAPFLGPLGPYAAAAGSGKEYGGIDYDLVAMTMAMNSQQAPTTPTGSPAGPPGSAALGTAPYSLLATQAGGPTFMQNLGQGISNAAYNTRDFLAGNPADRNLGLGFQNPFQGGLQSPITMNPGSSWTNMGSMFSGNPDWDLIKEGAADIGAAGSAQYGMVAQKELIEDYKKNKERDEARNRAYWQNYFAGMERYRPYRTGEMGDEMDALYAQYGAADEYDPYHGMRDAYAGTYFDEDRWYRSYKKGGRVDYAGGGNPHRDIAKPIRPGGLNNLMRKYKEHLAKIENKKRANIRERSRVGLALGGNDEVGGLSSLTSEIPQNVPGVPNGMQIDARRPGGTYIDAGTKPKADDVAAMLSEGEFVITKDGMEGFDLQTGGPGDSRSGAKKMYAQMNEWETVAAQAGV